MSIASQTCTDWMGLAILALSMGCFVLSMALLDQRSRMRRLQLTLLYSHRGIYKRIDEVREMAELLEQEAPRLCRDKPLIVGWLVATDDFLCHLRDGWMPRDRPVGHVHKPRSREIYARLEHHIRQARNDKL
jgi:hypothetical protein